MMKNRSTNFFNSPPFSITSSPPKVTDELLEAIFPDTTIESIAPVSGGLSNANIFKVMANKKAYVLRSTAGIFGADQLQQEFDIQQQASELGVTPKVHYANDGQGVIVMDYIDNQLPPGRDVNTLSAIESSYEQLMRLIKQSHDGLSIKNDYRYHVALDYIRYSVEQLPRDFLCKEDGDIVDRLLQAPFPETEMVITHNDFRSGNLLYDDNRFWMIDWELSGPNHRYYDVAYFANYQDLSKEEGNDLLSLYLQKKAGKQQISDFNYFRRMAFAFSALLALPGLVEEKTLIMQARTNEADFSSVSELWDKLDAKDLSFDNPRDEYRISLFLLRQAVKF